MASPQIENGHTDIANELLDALCRFRIPGECRQVLDAIMRKTYGYHKAADWVSGSQLVEMTGLSKGNVSRSLSRLVATKIVIQLDNKMLSVNKDYSQWVSFSEVTRERVKVIQKDNNEKVIQKDNEVIQNDNQEVIQTDNKKLSKWRDTKENKKNNTTPIIPTEENEDDFLFEVILQAYRDHTGSTVRKISPQTKANILFWRETYEDIDLIKAAGNCRSPGTEFFQTMTLDKLFRKTNQNGSADYVEQILSHLSKKKPKF